MPEVQIAPSLQSCEAALAAWSPALRHYEHVHICLTGGSDPPHDADCPYVPAVTLEGLVEAMAREFDGLKLTWVEDFTRVIAHWQKMSETFFEAVQHSSMAPTPREAAIRAAVGALGIEVS